MLSDVLSDAANDLRGQLNRWYILTPDGVGDIYGSLVRDATAALVEAMDAMRGLPGLDCPPEEVLARLGAAEVDRLARERAETLTRAGERVRSTLAALAKGGRI